MESTSTTTLLHDKPEMSLEIRGDCFYVLGNIVIHSKFFITSEHQT